MNHARRFVPLAVFVLVPSFLILPILFSGKMLYGHDVESVFHSQRMVIAQAFREGRLPVWDPTVMAGFPLLAAVQGAIFYPPTWLCALMSAGAFWTLSAWAHLILAGVFAHRWLERGLGVGPWAALAGAFVFMMSGYIVGHLYAGHVNYAWAYPWMPALLWRLERFFVGPTLKRGVLLAVVLAMLFLAGVPQFVYFAGLIGLARGLHFILSEKEGRRERGKVAGKAVAWLALGMLFCAPQLFPTLELVGEMQRGTADDEGFRTQYEYELHPAKLVEILWPPDHESYYPFWERCAFLGGGALLLLLAAFAGKHPQRYLWAGVAGVALLMAMGLNTPVYPGVTWLLPGAGLFRVPGRYLLLFTLGATALVAIGVHSLVGRWRMGGGIAAAAFTIASAVQLSVYAHEVLGGIDPWQIEFVSWLPTVRQAVGPEERIATTTAEDIGSSQASGVETVCGYEPMMLRRYAELMNAAQGYPPEKNIVVMASVGAHPVVDMLAVRGWLVRDYPKGPRSLHPPRTVKKKLQENLGVLPRAWLVNNAVVIESREERLKVLAKGPWDPRKTVILEQYPNEAPPVATEGPAGRAKVVSRRPGEYVLEAENSADAYLVLSEAYYPGWSAEVDGKRVDVAAANHLIQAIRLPPGKHAVRFAYRSRFLGAGFAVALLAALVPVALVLVRRRRG